MDGLNKTDCLTNKQRRFVEEYLIDLNATQASIRAGYSKKTAQAIGSENLTKPLIVKALKLAFNRREDDAKKNGVITIDPSLIRESLKYIGDIEILRRIATDAVKDAFIDLGVPSKIVRPVNRSRSIDSESRYTVLFRANFKCQACGAKPSSDNDVSLHIDHVTPFSWGGSNDVDNLQVLCADCNISKSNFYDIDHRD